MKSLFIFTLFFFLVEINVAQDLLQQPTSISCGTTESVSTFCNSYPTYFPMVEDTLRALVVFANYPDGNFDPIVTNSNLIYMQHWPGTNGQHLQKPSWADSIICPSTTNVWNPSLTSLFKVHSNGSFWLIGDVYNSIVILNNNTSYYTPANGRHIGYAVREILDEIAPNVNFANYDNLDPCDYDNDGKRNEFDGTVDFIFIIFRFNNSASTDPNPMLPAGYQGVAKLGGHNGTFGDSVVIMKNGKKIRADFPGSGCISDMYNRWFLGVPAHEFGQHYGIGVHTEGWGSHNINGGGIASNADRIHFGWSFGNSIQPTQNTTDINLRDYVTTGDNITFFRYGKRWHIVNLQRLNYYSSKSFHSWRSTINEPLLPVQRDSGLLIYRTGAPNGITQIEHAFGNWNFTNCNVDTIFKIVKTPYYNQFLPLAINPIFGYSVMDFKDMWVKDVSCNTVVNQYTNANVLRTSYIGLEGDSNMCFDVDYNMVYSPWSNPTFQLSPPNDSITIELTGRESDGSLNLNIFFTNMTLSAPSKPQFLKTIKQHNSSPYGSFYVRLNWLRNREPDMSTYGIYKATTNTPGVDATYSWIGSTSDTTYLDQTILLYEPNLHYSGGCAPQPVTFSYRVTATDLTDKESVMSERDSIFGYVDPCEAEIEGENLQLEGLTIENKLLQNFPNPFNPKTRIQYSLRSESDVTITLYDVTGKSILVLVNDFKSPGNHFVDFDAGKYSLSSGIYFYKIEAINFTEIRQMILIK